jgi:hypothetical protein
MSTPARWRVAQADENVVGPTELESVTSCVSSRRSNQLSYGPGLNKVTNNLKWPNPQYITPPSLR